MTDFTVTTSRPEVGIATWTPPKGIQEDVALLDVEQFMEVEESFAHYLDKLISILSAACDMPPEIRLLALLKLEEALTETVQFELQLLGR